MGTDSNIGERGGGLRLCEAMPATPFPEGVINLNDEEGNLTKALKPLRNLTRIIFLIRQVNCFPIMISSELCLRALCVFVRVF